MGHSSFDPATNARRGVERRTLCGRKAGAEATAGLKAQRPAALAVDVDRPLCPNPSNLFVGRNKSETQAFASKTGGDRGDIFGR